MLIIFTSKLDLMTQKTRQWYILGLFGLITAMCAKKTQGSLFTINEQEDSLPHPGSTISHYRRPQQSTTMITFATLLYNIELNSCYACWGRSDHATWNSMQQSLRQQSWKIVWLFIVGWQNANIILLMAISMAKIGLDMLQRKGTTLMTNKLPHWSIGFVLLHLLLVKGISLSGYERTLYGSFVCTFALYYFINKYVNNLSKYIIGDQKRQIYYFFKLFLGILCAGLSYTLQRNYMRHFWDVFFHIAPFILLCNSVVASFVFELESSTAGARAEA